MSNVLSDFGGFPPSNTDEVYRPRSLDELQITVRGCFERGKRMRVRCFAHSMNGMSVPRPDETLLDITSVRHVCWKEAGRVAAGAGLSVWELDQYVRQFGWKLPVINDGGAEAPSIGGFIAAGGIGEGTVFYGGFWESVSSITLVAGDGNVRHLVRHDPVFPWLFGSMGTLGIVYEATLDLVPSDGALGTPIDDSASLPRIPSATWPKHLWLTLFVGEERRNEASDHLRSLMERHPNAWEPRDAYEYYLLHRCFNPPLLFDGDRDFIALGFWGDRIGGKLDNYFALEEDFQNLTEQCGFRRYFQTELIWRNRSLEHYVGRACATRYQAFKKLWDPRNLLNEFDMTP